MLYLTWQQPGLVFMVQRFKGQSCCTMSGANLTVFYFCCCCHHCSGFAKLHTLAMKGCSYSFELGSALFQQQPVLRRPLSKCEVASFSSVADPSLVPVHFGNESWQNFLEEIMGFGWRRNKQYQNLVRACTEDMLIFSSPLIPTESSHLSKIYL